MEVVLELYQSEHTEEEPLVCMDEAAIAIHSDIYEPMEMKPGRDAKEDYHYQREGTRALFMFINPIKGWRRVSSREHRTRIDWAEEIKQLLEIDYPHARKVKLLCDNLNTHHIASLYEAFSAEDARIKLAHLYPNPTN